MRYRVHTNESVPLVVPEGSVTSGFLCYIESQVPISKGDRMILDTTDKKFDLNNVRIQEVEVVRSPHHVVEEEQVAYSVLEVHIIS